MTKHNSYIKKSNSLNYEDWKNLNGNDLYITMLRHKTSVYIPKNKVDILYDYLASACENLYHISVDDVLNFVRIHVYFENPVDMENYIATCNTTLGIEKINDV